MTAPATCPDCNRGMRIAASCEERPGAVRYGDEPYAAQTGLAECCPDCGVNAGGVHHRGVRLGMVPALQYPADQLPARAGARQLEHSAAGSG